MRVAIVSPDSLLREALAGAIGPEPGIDLVAEIHTRPSFPSELALLGPDAILVHAPSAEILIQVCGAACASVPTAKVLALGAPPDTESALRLIEVGVVGIIPKQATFSMVLEALAAIRSTGISCSPGVVGHAFARLVDLCREARCRDRSEVTRLTPRELQVVSVLSRGLSNKEIAHQLCVDPQTIKNHVHNILDKLQLRNRVEIAQYAMERNMILPAAAAGE